MADKKPVRGEIWYVKLPTDPPDKAPRPVLIVSANQRNLHPRADTVMVVPFSTSITRDVPTHLYLGPEQTGLEYSVLKAEDVTVVRKTSLVKPRTRLRNLSSTQICELAEKIRLAMNC